MLGSTWYYLKAAHVVSRLNAGLEGLVSQLAGIEAVTTSSHDRLPVIT